MDTRFIKRQMTAAYQYSYTRLALNYYTFYEAWQENRSLQENVCGCLRKLNRLMEDYFDGGDIMERLACLRNEAIHEVGILTAYADCFQIYEYVLNRLERRFQSMPEAGIEDEAFAGRLASFLGDARDFAVRNERIHQIIGQLPVRMTRQKFYHFVMESLSVYIGSPVANLEDRMNALKTGAMASLPAGMAKNREFLYKTLTQFRHMDYRSLSCEAFEEAQAKLLSVSAGLSDEIGCFVSLQQIINDFYVLSLAGKDAVIDVSEENLCRSIILGALTDMGKEEASKPEEDYEALLMQLEGRQEACYERYLRSEFPRATPELLADPDYEKAFQVDLLLSGSLFMDLKRKGGKSAEEGAIVDRAYLEKTAESYFQQLDAVFSTVPRQVVRAIMARVLSDLPVFFRSMDEIKAYIRESLESCGDEAEKETCKELLEELMDYENKLV